MSMYRIVVKKLYAFCRRPDIDLAGVHEVPVADYRFVTPLNKGSSHPSTRRPESFYGVPRQRYTSGRHRKMSYRWRSGTDGDFKLRMAMIGTTIQYAAGCRIVYNHIKISHRTVAGRGIALQQGRSDASGAH